MNGYFNQEAILERLSATSDRGDESFEQAEMIKCHFRKKQKRIKSSDGIIYQSSYQVKVSESLGIGDFLTIEDNRLPIREITPFYDLGGELLWYNLVL